MTRLLSLKFLPLAVLLAVGAALFSTNLPDPPKPASANVLGSVLIGGAAPTFNVQASYSNTPNAGATLSANGFGTFTSGAATVSPAGGSVGAASGLNTVTLVFPQETGGLATDTITISATFTCNAVGTVSFTVTQAGGAPSTASSSAVSCSTVGGGTGTGITFSPPQGVINQQVQVSVYCPSGGQVLQVGNTGGGTGQFVSNPVGFNYIGSMTLSCQNLGPATAYFICTTAGSFTFTLGISSGVLYCGTSSTGYCPYQGAPGCTTGYCPYQGAPGCSTGYCPYQGAPGCVSSIYGTTGGITVTPPQAAIGQTASVIAQCQVGQVLTATGNAGFFSGTPSGGTLSGQNAISCYTTGQVYATFQCQTTGTEYFSMSGGQYGAQYGYVQPGYQTPNYGTQSGQVVCGTGVGGVTGTLTSITLSAAPTTISQCGGSAFITASAPGATDGTTLQFTASAGSVSPSTATTSASNATVIYTAPASGSGTAQVQAKSATGITSNQLSLTVNCAAAATTTAPAAVVAPPPPPSTSVIRAPNTGDAGLLALRDRECD